VSRRTALAGALGLSAAASAPVVLAGCTSGSPNPGPSGSTPGRPSPDDLARTAAAAQERALAAQATAVLAGGTLSASLRAAVTGAQTAHVAHAQALLPSSSGSPSNRPSGSASATGGTGAVTTTATASALARAEVATASAHQAALGPLSAELARLLASVAAGDAALASSLRAAR
jgi:hypothetical protein